MTTVNICVDSVFVVCTVFRNFKADFAGLVDTTLSSEQLTRNIPQRDSLETPGLI